MDAEESLKVVLAGGGTGGHVYPALAMGDALAARGHSLLYYGDADRLEGRVVPQRGIPFTAIRAAQYPRSGLASKVRFGLSLLSGILDCRRRLRRDGADLVLGVGGYISAPPVLAAWTLGIPTAIHEANVTPGMANRLCARVAHLVLLTYELTRGRLTTAGKVELVGCPVSRSVTQGDAARYRSLHGLSEDTPLVLVVGGSLGAATLNRLGLALARAASGRFQVALVTGPKYEAEVRAALGSVPKGVAVVGYETAMPDAYAAADLVVCRAGSSTLAELTTVGRASVLVPSPNVTDNHQEGNARGLEKGGAAEVLLEKGLDEDAAVAGIIELVLDPARTQAMAEAARVQAQPDTAGRVAELLESLVR